MLLKGDLMQLGTPLQVDKRESSQSSYRHGRITIVVAYVFIFWILLPAFLLITGFRFDALWPVTIPQSTFTILSGWTLLALGALMMVVGMAQLWFSGHGLPISHLPPTQIIVKGLYRYLRHPIYVGYSIAFAGAALVLGSLGCLAFSLPLLLGGWMAYALFLEEPMLVERYGDVYRNYLQQTGLLWPIPGSPHPVKNMDLWLIRVYEKINVLANQTVIYHHGSLIVVTYGLFCTFGGFLFAQSTAMLLIQQGLSPAKVSLLVIGMTLSACFFAWLFWWIGNWRSLIDQRWWGIGQVGFVSYGGLTGIILCTVVYAYLYDCHPLMLLDALMQGFFFAYALGRIGCLTYGCCYGNPTQKPYGIIYKNPEAKVFRSGDCRRIARYPTQLYSCLHGVVALVLINGMVLADIPVGLVTSVSLMLAGLGRTFTESFRDRERPLFGRFSLGHLGSWVTFVAGWLLLLILTPGVDTNAPQPWSGTALVESLSVLPAVLISSLLVLIIYGVHWKRLGFWVG